MMKWLLAVLLVAIVVISGCIGNQGSQVQNQNVEPNSMVGKYVLNASENKTVENQSTTTTGNSGNVQVKQTTCENNKVYFIYADWCPHCQKMKPWVSQLESEGYLFTRIDSQSQDAINTAKECLTGIAQLKYIPEFVCPANKKDHVGEFASIDEMKAFVAECNGMQ